MRLSLKSWLPPFLSLCLLLMVFPAHAAGEFQSFLKLFSEKSDDVAANSATRYVLQHPDMRSPSGNSIIGNPNGDITMVEFFDYRCGYCKQMPAIFSKLTKKDHNLRIVMKDYVLFGPDSEFASRAVLAANEQANSLAFHDALLRAQQLTPAIVMATAKRFGFNIAQLQQAMQSSRVTHQLETNAAAAEALGITGTPAFVLFKTSASLEKKSPVLISLGSMTVSEFREAIAVLRKAG